MRVDPPFRGEPRAQCDRCGGVFHKSDLRPDGQTRGNLLVCSRCWDPIHPQEFLRSIPDRQAFEGARHVPTTDELTFVDRSETGPFYVDFEASTASGAAPLAVDFTNTSVGSCASWRWSFGDGNSSTSASPSHTYAAPGTYSVKLECLSGNAGGMFVLRENYIRVIAPTVADFVADQTGGEPPLTVNFTDLSTGGPTAWTWDFGDGNTSTQRHPTHAYDAEGVYTVTLTTSGPGGSDTETKTDYITVAAASAGTWLITSINAARTGAIGGAWSDLPLPASFYPEGYGSGRPAAVASDGAGGLLIGGSKAGDGFVGGVSSGDGGASWTLLKYGVNETWNLIPPMRAAYLLGKFAVAIDSTSDGELHTSADAGTWEQITLGISDVRAIGNVCEHAGYAYIAAYRNLASNMVVARSSTMASSSWTVTGTAALGDPTDSFPLLLSDGSRLIMVTYKGYVSHSDDDGATWPTLASTVIPVARGAAIGNGYVVVVTGGNSKLYIATVADLVFSEYTPPGGATTWADVAFSAAEGRFLAVGDDGSNGVAVSFSDPSTFTVEGVGFEGDYPNGVTFLG